MHVFYILMIGIAFIIYVFIQIFFLKKENKELHNNINNLKAQSKLYKEKLKVKDYEKSLSDKKNKIIKKVEKLKDKENITIIKKENNSTKIIKSLNDLKDTGEYIIRF